MNSTDSAGPASTAASDEARAARPVAERRQRERRRTSLHSFLYGSVNPRRRRGRRAEDHEQVFLDWHEPAVLYLVLGILLMSCADALLTLNLLHLGAREVNRLMDLLIVRDVGAFLAVKIGVTAVAVVVLGIAARRRLLGRLPVMHILKLLAAGYAALLGWELWLMALLAGQAGAPPP